MHFPFSHAMVRPMNCRCRPRLAREAVAIADRARRRGWAHVAEVGAVLTVAFEEMALPVKRMTRIERGQRGKGSEP